MPLTMISKAEEDSPETQILRAMEIKSQLETPSKTCRET